MSTGGSTPQWQRAGLLGNRSAWGDDAPFDVIWSVAEFVTVPASATPAWLVVEADAMRTLEAEAFRHRVGRAAVAPRVLLVQDEVDVDTAIVWARIGEFLRRSAIRARLRRLRLTPPRRPAPAGFVAEHWPSGVDREARLLLDRLATIEPFTVAAWARSAKRPATSFRRRCMHLLAVTPKHACLAYLAYSDGVLRRQGYEREQYVELFSYASRRNLVIALRRGRAFAPVADFCR